MAVADVVESMASHRPYRPALGIEAALNEIEKNKGIFYDNAVADACLRLFRDLVVLSLRQSFGGILLALLLPPHLLRTFLRRG
jgi:HD-GYP domain-containing protein (c-di-GMP phosphodiesterase class II)